MVPKASTSSIVLAPSDVALFLKGSNSDNYLALSLTKYTGFSASSCARHDGQTIIVNTDSNILVILSTFWPFLYKASLKYFLSIIYLPLATL